VTLLYAALRYASRIKGVEYTYLSLFTTTVAQKKSKQTALCTTVTIQYAVRKRKELLPINIRKTGNHCYRLNSFGRRSHRIASVIQFWQF